MKKNNSEKLFNKLSIYFIATIGILFGILLLAISGGLAEYNGIINTLGQLSITVSVGSIFMEWFGYINYTRKRMCEILIEDEVIKVLDMKRKKELKSALIKNIYMNNAPNLQLEENNIATIFDSEMDNILKDYYFEEYIIYVDVLIEEQDGKKYIKKKFRHTFTARTINNNKCTLENLIDTYLKPPSNGNDAVRVKKCIINNETQDVEMWRFEAADNLKDMKETYPKHYSFQHIIDDNKKLFTFSDILTMDLEYITYVDIDDPIYVYQINKPCKHFCMHYNVPKEYRLLMEGFGFMTTCNKQRIRIVETENGCMIRFLDWILPGDGIMCVIQEK